MRFKFSSLPAHLTFFLAVSTFPLMKAGTGADLKNNLINTKFDAALHQSVQGFSENKGQIKSHDGLAHPEVKFAMEQGATGIFLLPSGIAYQFTSTHYPQGYLELMHKRTRLEDEENIATLRQQIRTESFRMDMVLKGANTNARITTEGKSADFINYYNHNVLDVHHYSKIIYHEVYPGIDWVIYTRNGAVKYDFVLKPGADPTLIQLEFKHQEGLGLNKDGSITLGNRLGSITEKKPLSLQGEKEITTRFVLYKNTVSFALGNYNTSLPLTIDPTLAWATYYGGPDDDIGFSCATDAAGNVYLAGMTSSSLAIAAGGYQNTYGGGISMDDAFLVKFNAGGTRLWATYYGGSEDEVGHCCATDGAGNVYLAGLTTSPTNIASAGHQNTIGGGVAVISDAFLVKFNAAGVRQWATYYGGANNDRGFSCATDAAGNVFLAGIAQSTSGIASGGFQNTITGGSDAFLVKFNAAGVRQWGTYYGDTGGDIANACLAEPGGNVYLAGEATSTINIASGGHQNTYGGGFEDAFLVKFDGNGLRLWGTYYGGNNIDKGYNCALDGAGNIYLCGTTTSTINIASGGYQNTFVSNPAGAPNDAFLVKFNSSGVRQWGTYYGDTGFDLGQDCAVDAAGDVYLAGTTTSTANIASQGYQNLFGGVDDGFLVKFNAAGARLWATYYGGPNDEFIYSVTDGPSGAVYLGGYTYSSSQIAYQGFQNSMGSPVDGFLAKFCTDAVPPFTINGNNTICSGISQIYTATSNTAITGYFWTLPNGWTGTPNSNSVTTIPNLSGNVSVYATNACGAGLIQNLTVTVTPSPTISIQRNPATTVICSGVFVSCTASGAGTFTWNPGGVANGLFTNPTVTTVYTVSGSNGNCTSASSFTLAVNQCIGIAETAMYAEALRVYPNPGSGLFYVESKGFVTLQVYDGTGKLVLQSSCTPEGKEQLDLTNYSKGVYCLKLQGAQGQRTLKLIYQ